jgi:hypothetical protein
MSSRDTYSAVVPNLALDRRHGADTESLILRCLSCNSG